MSMAFGLKIVKFDYRLLKNKQSFLFETTLIKFKKCLFVKTGRHFLILIQIQIQTQIQIQIQIQTQIQKLVPKSWGLKFLLIPYATLSYPCCHYYQS